MHLLGPQWSVRIFGGFQEVVLGWEAQWAPGSRLPRTEGQLLRAVEWRWIADQCWAGPYSGQQCLHSPLPLLQTGIFLPQMTKSPKLDREKEHFPPFSTPLFHRLSCLRLTLESVRKFCDTSLTNLSGLCNIAKFHMPGAVFWCSLSLLPRLWKVHNMWRQDCSTDCAG